MEARFGANDELVRQIRDAVTVHAYWEASHSKAMKDHGVWLQEHDAAIAAFRHETEQWAREGEQRAREGEQRAREAEQRAREFDERMKTLDQRIASLVSGFGEFIRQNRI
jgi:hypothetical protein